MGPFLRSLIEKLQIWYVGNKSEFNWGRKKDVPVFLKLLQRTLSLANGDLYKGKIYTKQETNLCQQENRSPCLIASR